MNDETQVIAKTVTTDKATTTTVGPVNPADSSMTPGDSHVMQVSIRAWVCLIIVFTICVMAGFQVEVTEPLHSLALLVVGFYFGQKKAAP